MNVKSRTAKLNQEPVLKQPFSNMQLELLKLYASHVTDDDLVEIKEMLAKYFFEKAKAAANKAWDEKGLDEETLLKVHERTPYPRPK